MTFLYTFCATVLVLATVGAFAAPIAGDVQQFVSAEHDSLSNLRQELRDAQQRMKTIERSIAKFENSANLHAAGNPGRSGRHRRVVLFTLIFGEQAIHAPHLPLWAKSAEGSGVDYIILSDNDPPFDLPANMRHISITWERLARLISGKLLDGYWPQDRQLLFQWASKYVVIKYSFQPPCPIIIALTMRTCTNYVHVVGRLLQREFQVHSLRHIFCFCFCFCFWYLY